MDPRTSRNVVRNKLKWQLCSSTSPRQVHDRTQVTKLINQEVTSALRHTRQKAWATDARTRNLQARQTNLHDRLSRLVFQIDQALPPEGSADASTTADMIHKLESSKLELEGTSKRGKESLRAQVNHLRGRIAELRRFPVRQDQDVGWLADPEAQAQIGEVSRFPSHLHPYSSPPYSALPHLHRHLSPLVMTKLIVDPRTTSIGIGGNDGNVEQDGI
jgi:hypothetical protein